jgi:hypothetical protein
MFEVDPAAGSVSRLPALSDPVSDAAVAAGPAGGWLLGGWNSGALAQVLHIRQR